MPAVASAQAIKVISPSSDSSSDAMFSFIPTLVTETEQQEVRNQNRTAAVGARKRKAAVAVEESRMKNDGLTPEQLVETACPPAKLAAVAVATGIVDETGDFNESAAQEKLEEAAVEPPAPAVDAPAAVEEKPAAVEPPAPAAASSAQPKRSHALMELPIEQLQLLDQTWTNREGALVPTIVPCLLGQRVAVELMTIPKMYLKLDFPPEHPSYGGSERTNELFLRATMPQNLSDQWEKTDEHIARLCKEIPAYANLSWYLRSLQPNPRFGIRLSMKVKLIGADATMIIFKKGENGPIVKGWGAKFYADNTKDMDCVGCRPTVVLPPIYLDKHGIDGVSMTGLAYPVCKQIVFMLGPKASRASSSFNKTSSWGDVVEDDL